MLKLNLTDRERKLLEAVTGLDETIPRAVVRLVSDLIDERADLPEGEPTRAKRREQIEEVEHLLYKIRDALHGRE